MCFVQVSCKMFGWRGGQTLQGWAGWPGLRFLFPFRFLLLHNSSGPSLGVTCFCQYFSCKIVVRWKVKVVFVPEEESQESLTFSKRYHDSFSSHCVYNLSLHYVMYFNLATCRQTSSSILWGFMACLPNCRINCLMTMMTWWFNDVNASLDLQNLPYVERPSFIGKWKIILKNEKKQTKNKPKKNKTKKQNKNNKQNNKQNKKQTTTLNSAGFETQRNFVLPSGEGKKSD